MTGQRNVDVEPLGKYLHNSQHPTENPSTLLSYSASTDNISSLGMRRFLHYGIPRAKVNPSGVGGVGVGGRRQNESSSSSVTSLTSHAPPPSTYTIHEHPGDERRDHRSAASAASVFDPPPYHPPEPDPDYEQQRRGGGGGGGGGDIDDDDDDDITAPGGSSAGGSSGSGSSTTDSSDTETLYVPRRSPLSHKSSAELTTTSSGRRPLSRTYSTLNALDPIYMTQTSRGGATLAANKHLPSSSSSSSRQPPVKPAAKPNARSALSNIYSPTPAVQMQTQQQQQQQPQSHLPHHRQHAPAHAPVHAPVHTMSAPPEVKPIAFYPSVDVIMPAATLQQQQQHRANDYVMTRQTPPGYDTQRLYGGAPAGHVLNHYNNPHHTMYY